MGVVIDLVTRLPMAIWFAENPRASDTRFEDNLLELVSAKTLLLLDRGFYHFLFWQQLIDQEIHFITRRKINAAIQYQQVFTDGHALRDRLVKIGSGTKTTPIVTLRLIEVRVGKVWRSYLTSVLEPEILPPYVVIDLYQKRWRIEDAFNTVKRLLGLSYLWTGSINGIKLQIWATWLFYAVLVDLGDEDIRNTIRIIKKSLVTRTNGKLLKRMKQITPSGFSPDNFRDITILINLGINSSIGGNLSQERRSRKTKNSTER